VCVCVCPEDVWEIRGGKHQCALPPTFTLPLLPECVTSKSWLYIIYTTIYLLLFSYHAASYLKKGSLFRVCTHFGFIQLLSLLHLQPKLPDRCVAIAM
jgi:hypothetical protein